MAIYSFVDNFAHCKEQVKKDKMKRAILTWSALLFCSTCIWAQNPLISPTPQQYITGERSYSLPESFLFNGLNETDSINRSIAQNLLPQKGKSKKYWRLTIGERGDRSVRSVANKIPKKADGYYLRIKDKEIVVAGNDERGTLYGLHTLQQILKQKEIPALEITDYPDVPVRGIVEGYYGTPMDFPTHLRMLKYYGMNKMNAYLYGPKDDPYHSSPNWRKPYPQKEADEIREMARVAKENGIDFVWAIHPGKDIRWNEADRDSVVQKFESMYQLGVRAFAVFFDDISGEGAKAEKQVELLNYIDDHFIHAKKDVKPLIMCPTEYNKSWADPNGSYLSTLGEKLNQDISIMWTGNSVICNIQSEDMDWINEQIKRKAFIWWNFPVNDYVMDHLLMGPVYGNSKEIADKLFGFVSNPMEYAEASKIAIYSIADYVWNMKAFDSDKSWDNSIKDLLPSNADALRLFSEHNSDAGPNVHLFSRDESVRIQPAINDVLSNALNNAVSFKEGAVLAEFENIIDAADILMADQENPYLKKELLKWYPQFKLLGEMGVEVMHLYKAWQDQYQDAFLKSYRHLRALQYLSYKYDQETNTEASQPGIKTGSKILRPFVDKLFTHLVNEYNHRFGATLATSLNYSHFKLESDVEQLKNLAVTLRNETKVSISALNEVLKWKENGSMTLSLEEATPAVEFRIDLGTTTLDWIKLEIQKEDGEWETAELPQLWSMVYRSKLNETKIKAIRLSNISGKQQECYLKSCYLMIKNKE